MIVEATIGVAAVAALVVFIAPDRVAGRLAAVLSLFPLAGSALMWWRFDATGNALTGGEPAFETTIPWMELGGYTVRWHVGLDGVSLPLVLLTTVLTTLAVVSAWPSIEERQAQFYGLVLALEAALLGVFAALDFFVWFVFWEAVLAPMYLLVGVWGGPRRKYAAIKFFVYTNVASLAMFIAFVALVLAAPVETFSLPAVSAALRSGELAPFAGLAPETLRIAAFVVIFAGFAVKVPIVPFHTWLPDAHVEAPSPVSVLLAGVLLKMGTYALLRFNFTMLPDTAARLAAPIAALAVVSVLYGALLALAQRDLKRVVAYSSVSSMGYVLLGLVAYTLYGVGGATFQMVAHGLLSGLLFMAVGVVYHETHTRMIDDISGLADRMPVTTGIFVAGAFGYMGLPLMAGFAAEFFVFLGAFGSETLPLAPLVTAVATFGIVVVAGYLLFAMQRTLFGPFRVATGAEAAVEPAPAAATVPLALLLLCIVALGVAPDLIFAVITDAVAPLVGGGA